MKNSNIILAKGIKIDKNYNTVLNYTENNLLALLRSNDHIISESINYSFIDEFQNSVIVQNPIGQVYLCNYLAFQNPRYNNKWFFCFVDKVEYNSDNSSKITFHTDVWETWYNNLSFKECYVIREHANVDTIGSNTVEEGLDVGEVVCESIVSDSQQLNTSHYICLATNWDIPSKTGYTEIACYNRVVWSNMIAVFPLNAEGIVLLKKAIMQTNVDGHIEDVHNMFIVPRKTYSSKFASHRLL